MFRNGVGGVGRAQARVGGDEWWGELFKHRGLPLVIHLLAYSTLCEICTHRKHCCCNWRFCIWRGGEWSGVCACAPDDSDECGDWIDLGGGQVGV